MSKSETKKDTGPKNKGKRWGLNVRESWMKLLIENEKAPKSAKRTDEEILAEMQKEFPSRTSFEFTDVKGVSSVRRGYNRGVFTEGKVPSLQSHRYDAEGNQLTARGKVVGAEKPAKAPSAKGAAKGGGKKPSRKQAKQPEKAAA